MEALAVHLFLALGTFGLAAFLRAGVPMLTGAIGTAIGVGPVFLVIAGFLFAGGWVTRDQWNEPNPRVAPH